MKTPRRQKLRPTEASEADRLEDALRLDAEIRSLAHHHDQSLGPIRAEVDDANARLAQVLVLVDALAQHGSPFERRDDVNELVRLFEGSMRIAESILALHAVHVDDRTWHGMKGAIVSLSERVTDHDQDRQLAALETG
jgi:hypothetical protein